MDSVSPAWLKVRLFPDRAPWAPLRPGWSAAAVAGPLAGVEAASEALSTLSTEGGRAAGSGDDEAGEVSFPFPLALGEPDFFPGLSENPLSSLGDSLRTNTVLEAPGRLERRLVELAEDAGMVTNVQELFGLISRSGGVVSVGGRSQRMASQNQMGRIVTWLCQKE